MGRTIQFLTSNAFKEVSNILKDGSEVVLAVAYWGDGAARRLGLTRMLSTKTSIICDLWSGACNPFELRRLKRDGFKIRTLDRLHAKVYWTPEAAIVGSANASTNGLGGDDTEQKGNMEASVLIRDATAVAAIEKWLVPLRAKADKVTDLMLKDAEELWRLRQRGRPLYSKKLSQLLKQPSSLIGRDWVVYCYVEHGYTSQGRKVLAQTKSDYGASIDGWELDKSDKPCPGRLVLDFVFRREKLVFAGAWRHAEISPKRTTKDFRMHFAVKQKTLNGVVVDKEAMNIIKAYLLERLNAKDDPDETISLASIAEQVLERTLSNRAKK